MWPLTFKETTNIINNEALKDDTGRIEFSNIYIFTYLDSAAFDREFCLLC